MDPRFEQDGVLPQLSSAEELARAGAPAAEAGSGELRAKLANAMVGMKKEYYGRGPTAAKAWLLDDYVFVAMEGGLTRNEETLLAAGKADLVRSYRLSFQEAMAATTMGAVEEITGRRVATYHSQIVFEPTRAFEIFVLQPQDP
ncbi:MAG: hypothetical protein QOD55_321 [Solirubrobacteraceae bacterium]|jgi:uncharacterized protein YbcI|nr:hypothetical protein [Solirubrobacteraceae bacterium]